MEENEMEEWEIVEYKNYNNSRGIDDGERGSGKLGWMLETGLSLGKNAVVTGVIISSIPILVPPFVVVAALGCAFSLPLGFAYATYACTNKLMAKLLPRYPEGDEKQMEAALRDDAVTRIELVDDDIDNNKPPCGSVGPTIHAEKTDVYAAAADAEDISSSDVQIDEFVEKTDTVAKGRGGKRKTRKKKGKVPDDEKADQEKLYLGPVGDDKEQSPQEDKQAPSAESNHEVIVDEEEDMGELGQSVGMSETTTGGADDGELKHDNDHIPSAVDGGAPSDDVEHEVIVETNGKSETSAVDVDVDVVFTTDEGVVDKKIQVRSVTIYNEPAGGNDNQGEAKTVADDEVKEEKKDTRVVGDGARSDEGLFGEDEEIRKKMEGIRAIVGYKGPKGDSYTEELKALYVFVGIEPPADSADFQNKLRFLMSVIGLK